MADLPRDHGGGAVSSPPTLRRGFVDVEAGQAHYRWMDGSSGAQRPLVMIHASPGSAKMLEPLIAELGQTRPVFAIDTLGNGDSAPPPGVTALSDRPDLSVFVKGHQQAIDALGLSAFDLYGSHTGGNIASEIAIAWPDRVAHLILDGMSLFAEDEREEMLAVYAPGVELESDGAHLLRLWHFVRDTFLFWPWYKRDAAHARVVGLPPIGALHDKVIEVLKAAQTYHYAYNAAFLYRKEDRLPLITTPTLLVYSRDDMLLPYLDQVAALLPRARTVVSSPLPRERAAVMEAFLRDEARAGP